jgi:hypothetical protein
MTGKSSQEQSFFRDPNETLSVDGGSVTGFSLNIALQSANSVAYDFRDGSGPSISSGNDIFDIDGIFVLMNNINGFTATQSDYFALDSGDFEATLIGQRTSQDGFSWSGGIASIRLTSASYSEVGTVPEPASLFLLCFGLAGLGLSRRNAKFNKQ